jgi:hypothetical protein
VELQSQRLEKKIELEDMLQDLDFDAPAAKPTVGIDESAPTPAG